MRNVKKYMRTRESWARFKKTAGMQEDIEFQKAIRRAGIHEYTGLHWINGLTDLKLSTAIDFCNTFGLDMNRFANAMIEAWEIAEQRYQVEEAIVQAAAEEHDLEPEAVRRELRREGGRHRKPEDAMVILSDHPLLDGM